MVVLLVVVAVVVQYIRGNGTVVAVAVHYVAPREGTRTLYNIHHSHTRPRAPLGYAVHTFRASRFSVYTVRSLQSVVVRRVCGALRPKRYYL